MTPAARALVDPATTPAEVAATLPPGPAAPPLVQSLRGILDPLGFAAGCARRFGDCFTIRLLGQPPSVMFTTPEATREVLAAGQAAADLIEPIVGRYSVIVQDGARHLRQRRLMLPPFHGERMHTYGRLMQEAAGRAIDGWPIGHAFPVHRELQAITLEVIMGAVFGLEDGPDLARVRRCLLRLVELPNSPSAALLAVPRFRVDLGRFSPWGRFLRAREEFRAVIGVEVARRRAAGAGADILSMLLEARDEDGTPMGEEELFDQMFTLLMAGHETTAGQLAWALYQVLRHPDVLARLREEMGETAPAPEEVGRLPYLDAVVKEAQRLTPTVTMIGRHVRVATRITGVELPAGVNVGVSIQLLHHRADLWPDPQRFDPERFLRARPSPFAFLPFGGGDRRCLGAAFATWEMKIVLAEIVRRTRLRLAPGRPIRPVLRAVAVGPSRGLPVVMDSRAT